MRRFFSVFVVMLILAASLGGLIQARNNQGSGGGRQGRGLAAREALGASRVQMRDGRVLVTGGRKAGASLARAELIALDGSAVATTSMRSPRAEHASVLLADGRVLVSGGTAQGVPLASAEIYDPASGTWAETAPMGEPRASHTASLLLDGRVLIAGGTSLELFDPANGAFTFAGALEPARQGHAAAVLADGRVLLTGGFADGAALDQADLFDPSIQSLGSLPGRLTIARGGHSATAVSDGRIVLAGGSDGRAELRSVEVYDPASGTIVLTNGAMEVARSGHQAALMPQGDQLLITGGIAGRRVVRLAEILDVARLEPAGAPSEESSTGPSGAVVEVQGDEGTASSGSVSVLAAGSNPAGNLDQCRNGQITDPVPCTGSAWVNGNAGGSNAHWLEGQSIAYRLKMTGIGTSGTHTVTIEWDTTQGGKHALDYLTTFNRTETTADPCSGVSGCNLSVFDTEPIPLDPNVSAAGVPQVPGVFTLFNGTITGVSVYTLSGSYAGNSSTRITISFTASVANPVLAWSAHIATRLNWGPTSSAVAISGSPFHMRLIDLDGSGGNQDRGLSSDAVIFPGSITIIKDVANTTDPTDFNFTTTGLPPDSPFQLDDDGTNANPLSNTKVFDPILTFDTARTVTETNPAPAFALTALTCSIQSSQSTPGTATGNVGTRTATFNLKEGDTATCTFVNTLQNGTLRVIKNVVSNNGGTRTAADFTLHVKSGAADVSGSPQAGSATGTVYNLLPGTYAVSEDSPASLGYAQTGFTGDCNSSGSVTVVAGVERTCTITNDDIGPRLIVIKHVVNDNGGTSTAANFTMSVTATNASPASFAGAEAPGTTVTLNQGSYNVTETGPSGYTPSFSADCTGSISVGETKTCTVTNDDVGPRLIVIKHVVNNNGGTATAASFAMSVTGTTPNPSSFPGAEAPGTVVSLKQGSYNVTETGPSGYQATFSADCTGSIGVGETKTCTVTNDDIGPRLIVIKHVVNNNGGTATASSFTMSVTASNPTPPSFPGAEAPGTTVGIDQGSYNVTETGPSGYQATFSADCTGSISVGETKTCTVTNDDVGPRLIVIKHVVNNNGGTATAANFTMSVTATTPTPASFPGAEAPGTVVSLNQGSYNVTETGPSGYQASFSADCTGSISVGETKTCTVTNDDVSPRLIVIKHVVNNNGGTAAAASFTMSVTATSPSPASFPGAEAPGTTVTLNQGSYNVTETGPSGYQASFSADCTGSIAVGETKTCTVTNDDIGPRLIVIKHVVNNNGGTATAANFTMNVNATNANPASFPGAEAPGTIVSLNQGSYNVTESGPNVGTTSYTASYSSGCSGSIAVGETKTCTVTNDDDRATPSLTTTMSWILKDSATLTNFRPGAANASGATIVFSLYGPSDPLSCAQALFIDSRTVTGITSGGPFETPTGIPVLLPGTYRWVAVYSGDDNNAPTSTDCGEETHTITVGEPLAR